jgi:CRP-like cAMP-binding protein
MAIDDGRTAGSKASDHTSSDHTSGNGKGDDLQAALAQHFLPPHLSGDELQRLAGLASARRYHAGEAIFLAGDPGGSLLAVVKGQVRISAYSADGREALLNVIGPGDVFGEIDIVDGGDRTADAIAIEPTELLILHRRDFLTFLKHNPELGVRLMEVMCRRLRGLSEQLEDLNLLDLSARLAKRLLHLADGRGAGGRPGGGPGGGQGVRISQQQLASMLGAARETVNKKLRSLEDRGLIDVRRQSITLLNRQALRAVAGAGPG